jgi:hypothetical protein
MAKEDTHMEARIIIKSMGRFRAAWDAMEKDLENMPTGPPALLSAFP